jgi:hypothetical protein
MYKSYLVKNWLSVIMGVFFLYASLLRADWSMPPELIYFNNGALPSMATDGHGNSIAVWFDASGTGSMQAATLASGAVNVFGQPAWVLTTPITSSNAQESFISYEQSVGMDFNGNATAIWTDGTYIYANTLRLGQTTWSAPVIINTPVLSATVSNLYIAVAENGNAIVTWLSSTQPYEYRLFANVFDAGLQLWRGQVDILNGGVISDSTMNQVSVDPSGNGVVVTNGTSNLVQAISYNFTFNIWTQIPSIATTSSISISSTMDPAGNATIVWLEQDGTMNAATLLFNQSSFTNHVVLSSTAEFYTSFPVAVADALGNVVAAWPDISGGLASARYSSLTRTWTGLPLIDLLGNFPELISISGDKQGNVVAAWAASTELTGYVQTATLAANAPSWTRLVQLSLATGFNPVIVLTATGNAVIVWEDVTNIELFFGNLVSSNFLDIFAAPTPPLVLPSPYFKGKVIKNKFATQIDRIHQLTWGASPDPSVIEYRLYRNSKLIATFPANHHSFKYEDHNRSKKVKDVYRLVSIAADGRESSPLFVTLQ